MRVKRTREPYAACLPPVACEKSMAQRVAALAKRDQVSQGEIIRQAVTLFLAQFDHKMVEKAAKTEQAGAPMPGGD